MIMKLKTTLMFVAAAAMTFSSCSQVDEFVLDGNDNLRGGITFVAETPGVDNTRTEVGEENGQIVPLWSANQKLRYLYFDPENSRDAFKEMARTDADKGYAAKTAAFTLDENLDETMMIYNDFHAFTSLNPNYANKDVDPTTSPDSYIFDTKEYTPSTYGPGVIHHDILISKPIDLTKVDKTKPVSMQFKRLTSVLSFKYNFNSSDAAVNEDLNKSDFLRIDFTIPKNSYVPLNADGKTIGIYRNTGTLLPVTPNLTLPETTYSINSGTPDPGNPSFVFETTIPSVDNTVNLGVLPEKLDPGAKLLLVTYMLGNEQKGSTGRYGIVKEITAGKNGIEFVQAKRHKINLNISDDNLIVNNNILFSPRPGFVSECNSNPNLNKLIGLYYGAFVDNNKHPMVLKGKYTWYDCIVLNNKNNTYDIKAEKFDAKDFRQTDNEGNETEIYSPSSMEPLFELPPSIKEVVLPAANLRQYVISLDRDNMVVMIPDGSKVGRVSIVYHGKANNTRITILKKSSENINPNFVALFDGASTANIELRLCKELYESTPPVGNVWMEHKWNSISKCDAEGNLIDAAIGGLGEITDEDAF